MRRFSIASVALLCCVALPTAAFAQTAKSAAKTPAKADVKPAVAPAAPPSPELMKARMRPPVKGTAIVEFMQGPAKVANGDVATIIKVRNADSAPIIGLKIDQYFYAGQKEISACTGRVRNPIAAGEIIDVTLSCPNPKERATGSNLMFTHANGKVSPRPVKTFAEAAKKK
jgi:hypothetical protein